MKSTAKPRILLAEQKSIDHFICKKMLTQLGCDVDTADNGFHVIDAIREQRYDLVLACSRLPLLNGMETVLRIRGMTQGRSLPLIMMVDDNRIDEVFLSVSAGVNDFLLRPMAGYKLRELLAKWLGDFDLGATEDLTPQAASA